MEHIELISPFTELTICVHWSGASGAEGAFSIYSIWEVLILEFLVLISVLVSYVTYSLLILNFSYFRSVVLNLFHKVTIFRPPSMYAKIFLVFFIELITLVNLIFSLTLIYFMIPEVIFYIPELYAFSLHLDFMCF